MVLVFWLNIGNNYFKISFVQNTYLPPLHFAFLDAFIAFSSLSNFSAPTFLPSVGQPTFSFLLKILLMKHPLNKKEAITTASSIFFMY